MHDYETKNVIEKTAEKIIGASSKTSSSSDNVLLAVFKIDDGEFCVDINKIKEIIKVGNITRVPNAENYIEGVINLRGRIDLVLNLSRKLGLKQRKYDDKSRIIIIEAKNSRKGVIVDSVEEVLHAKLSDIQSPNGLGYSNINTDYLKGVFIFDKRLILMLNMSKVFGE